MEKERRPEQLREIGRMVYETNSTIIPEELLDSIAEAFYNFAREAGVAHGEWTELGTRAVSNFEWTALRAIFIDRLISSLEFTMFCKGDVPDDLLAYDENHREQ